ncbi:hypothetical protein DVG78_18980 [Runella aurantiaca]|uniref:Uncharacterized protein n=1 Tax=Runella aurantiaca TaxID=2282308 RepID=A0A369I719_9BACT|nr:hypothetical protein DVG78_18980 [Runella aurantiaca]
MLNPTNNFEEFFINDSAVIFIRFFSYKIQDTFHGKTSCKWVIFLMLTAKVEKQKRGTSQRPFFAFVS